MSYLRGSVQTQYRGVGLKQALKRGNRLLLVWVFLAWVGSFGCGKTSVNLNLNNATSGTGVPPAPSPSATEAVGIVEDTAGFYVKAIANADSDYIMHREDLSSTPLHSSSGSYNYDHPCTINDGDSTKNIVCYLEGNEMDLYFFGIILKHNFPSTMCSYAEILMPYYFKYPTAYGPSSSTSMTLPSGTVIDLLNSLGGKPYCAYDFSQIDADLPNCCLGKYSATGIKVGPDPQATSTPAPLVTATPAPTQADWGGKIGKCLGGPALSIQKLDKNGIPKIDTYYIEGKGLNGKYEIPAPIKKGDQYGNLYLANYFSTNRYNCPTPCTSPTPNPYTGGVTCGSGSYTCSLGTTNQYTYDDKTIYPAAFWLPNNQTVPVPHPSTTSSPYGPLIEGGQPFYEYRCLDRAHEVKYSILLLVRSWNQIAQAGVATSEYGNENGGGNPGETPPRSGVGIAVDPFSPEPSPFDAFPLQDYMVWDLIGPSYCPTFLGTGQTPAQACVYSLSPYFKGFPGTLE